MVRKLSLMLVLLLAVIVPVVALGAATASAACSGPGAPTTTQTKCVTAVLIPGNPLQSFDISFVNPHRAEYYLADRANAGIDILDTRTLTFKRRLDGFVGIKFNAAHTAIDNNHSGPDGVVTHGRWRLKNVRENRRLAPCAGSDSAQMTIAWATSVVAWPLNAPRW